MRFLKPKLATLQKESVLVQAVKKTVSYIRSHNWFADVLELDLATVNYPALLNNSSTTSIVSEAGRARRPGSFPRQSRTRGGSTITANGSPDQTRKEGPHSPPCGLWRTCRFEIKLSLQRL